MVDKTPPELVQILRDDVDSQNDVETVWDQSAGQLKYFTARAPLTSYKQGRTVYLNPDDLGTYATVAAALADVPVGGNLVLIADYDVSVHGTIEFAYGCSVHAAYFGSQSGGDGPFEGQAAILNHDNAGSQGSPQASCIKFSNRGASTPVRNARVLDVPIKHGGSDYAIVMDNTRWFQVRDVSIYMYDGDPVVGYGGIRLMQQPGVDPVTVDEATFYGRIERCQIAGFDHAGVWIEDTRGSKNHIHDCKIRCFSTTNAVAGVIVSTKDTLIEDSQIDCPTGPGVWVYATDRAGKDVVGVVIKRVLNEHDAALVKSSSESGTYVVRDLEIDNPICASSHADRVYWEASHTYDSRMTRPLRYGSGDAQSAFLGKIADFAATAENNLVTVHGEHCQMGYTDAGRNNLLVVEHADDRQLLAGPNLRGWDGRARAPQGETFDGQLVRRADTGYDGGVDGAWRPVGLAFNTPEDYSGLKIYVDAGDLSTMFQDAEETTPVTGDGQSVLAWRDRADPSVVFSNRHAIGGFTLGDPTTLDADTQESLNLGPGDTVTIGGVVVNAGPDINGSHAVLSRVDHNSATVDFDSTGGSYDVTGAWYSTDACDPQMVVDAAGRRGVRFNGLGDMLNGPAVSLGTGPDVTILTVVTVEDSATDDSTRPVIGRYYNSESARVGRWNSSDEYRWLASAEGEVSGVVTDQVLTTHGTLPQVCALVDDGQGNADSHRVYYGLARREVTDQGASAAFTRNTNVWQLGANGNSGGRDLGGTSINALKGILHAVAVWDRALTETEVAELMFYFTNRFGGFVSHDA